MSNIIAPRTILNRGQEVWNSKANKKRNSQVTKVERTGQNEIKVHHDDGSIFDCKVDPTKIRLREDSMRDAGGRGRFFLPDNIKVGNLMSNADRRKMGVEQDPALPDYQK